MVARWIKGPCLRGETSSSHQNHSDHDCHQCDGAGPYEQHHSPILRVKQVSASSVIALGPRPINEKVFQNLPVIRGGQRPFADLAVDRLACNLWARSHPHHLVACLTGWAFKLREHSITSGRRDVWVERPRLGSPPGLKSSRKRAGLACGNIYSTRRRKARA